MLSVAMDRCRDIRPIVIPPPKPRDRVAAAGAWGAYARRTAPRDRKAYRRVDARRRARDDG
jgi:hypothetical protein